MIEKTEIIRRLLGILALLIGSLGCAFQLYRFTRGQAKPLPVVTLLIIGATALITGLQFIFPEVLSALRRNREAFLGGEWWRLVTPLFVHAYGWWHACVNGVQMILFCPLAERLYGKKLLALYFVPGVVGEIFGYLWGSDAAGASLGIVGVMGALFAYVVWHRRELPGAALLFAICGMAAAVTLCFWRDVHGPPTILGFLLAGLMTIWSGRQARPATPD